MENVPYTCEIGTVFGYDPPLTCYLPKNIFPGFTPIIGKSFGMELPDTPIKGKRVVADPFTGRLRTIESTRKGATEPVDIMDLLDGLIGLMS